MHVCVCVIDDCRLVVLGVVLGILEWERSVPCVLLLWEYMIGYLVIFASSMAVEFSMCLLATRGSILDTTARAPMQYLLYIHLCEYSLFFFAVRLGGMGLLSSWNFRKIGLRMCRGVVFIRYY